MQWTWAKEELNGEGITLSDYNNVESPSETYSYNTFPFFKLWFQLKDKFKTTITR